jgi:hypothetical protein
MCVVQYRIIISNGTVTRIYRTCFFRQENDPIKFFLFLFCDSRTVRFTLAIDVTAQQYTCLVDNRPILIEYCQQHNLTSNN